MPGAFTPSPIYTYPTAGQGFEQGMSNLVNAYLQAQQMGLQRKQFQMQQAEMGYVPPHTEQQQVLATQGKNGQLLTGQPGVVPIDNTPSYVPGAPTGYGGQPGPRAGPVGVNVGGLPTPGLAGGPAFAQAARTIPGGGPTYVNKPVQVGGYYDLRQSLPYLQSEMNGRLMAAIYGGMYRQGEAASRYGHFDDQGNFIPGTDYLTKQMTGNLRNAGAINRIIQQYGPGTDASGQPVGSMTESRLTTQAPVLKTRADIAAQSAGDRAQALAERARHDRATEGTAAGRLAITQTTAAGKAAQLQKYGLLAPTEVSTWQKAYNAAINGFKTPEQAEAAANGAVAALRSAAGKDSLGTLAPKATAAPDTTTSPAGKIIHAIGSGISRVFHSGASTAPHVPTSGAEASGLPHSRAPQGGNAPTTRLGNRAVGDSSTGSYPRAANLPPSPGAATQRASKADIDAAYAKALRDGWPPDAAAAKRDSMYQANGITP